MIGGSCLCIMVEMCQQEAENWCWFISLLAEDLELGHGTGITVISDSHKGLLDAVSEWLPNAEHRKCVGIYRFDETKEQKNETRRTNLALWDF
ncbi:lipopolysaccharide-modifying protein, partial [Tanacetum coccineum]